MGNSAVFRTSLIATTVSVFFFLTLKSGMFFFGWYDDAILSVFTQPILFDQSLLNAPGSDLAFPNFILLKLSAWLSLNIKGANGYGWLLIAATISWALSFFFFLAQIFSSKQIRLFHSNRISFLLLSFTLLPIHFFLINYTSQAVLHTGLGLCMILFFRNEIPAKGNRGFIVVALLHIFLGLLLRYQAALLIGSLIIISLIIRKQLRHFSIGKVLALSAVLLTLPILTNSLSNRKERQEINNFNKYNFTANDSYFYKNYTGNDSAIILKQQALTSWSVLDKHIAGEKFLKSASGETPLDGEIIGNIPQKLKLIFRSLYQYNSHTPSLNLGYVFFAYVLFLLMLLIRHFETKKIYRSIFADQLFFWGFILAFGFFLKWEFRLISPLLFIYVLLLSITPKPQAEEEKNIKVNSRWSRFMLLPLAITFIFSGYVLINTLSDKYIERNTAAFMLEKIEANYAHCNFAMDVNSVVIPGLNVASKFENKCDNHFITTGEYWTYFYQSFRDYYQNKCGSYSLDTIYECLGSETNTYFLYNSDFKNGFTENYLNSVYHRKLNFSPVNGTSTISDTNMHLFFPKPYKFRLYRVHLQDE
jgi:hypothetical protein